MNKVYICKNCGNSITITSFWKWILAPHIDPLGIRKFKCPKCDKYTWAKQK